MQLSLFDEPAAPPAKALARRTDKQTSHKAAAEIAKILPLMESIALEAVLTNPGWTGREYDEGRNGDRVVGKRLSTLRDKGLVKEGYERTCRVSGRDATTWYPTTEALVGRLG